MVNDEVVKLRLLTPFLERKVMIVYVSLVDASQQVK